jgi:hypothetical protein
VIVATGAEPRLRSIAMSRVRRDLSLPELHTTRVRAGINLGFFAWSSLDRDSRFGRYCSARSLRTKRLR